jgi:hypothetical protein
MKKLIQIFLVAGFLATSSLLSAQSTSAPVFISKILPPIPVLMNDAGAIKVSYIDGLVNEASAFSLVFQNTTAQPLTFSWIMKDKNGKQVGDAHTMTIPGKSSIDYSTKSVFADSLIFMVSETTRPADCTIEITY